MSGDKPEDRQDEPEPEESSADPTASREPSAREAEGAVSARPAAEEAAPAPPRRRGGGLAVLALLVALGALGLSAWQFHLGGWGEPGEPDADALEADVATLGRDLSELQEGLDEAQSRQQAANARLDDLADELRELAEAVRELEQEDDAQQQEAVVELRRQVAELGDEVASLASRLGQAVDELAERGDLERRVDRDLQRQMLMLEAAGLLRTGQERAELAGDFAGAALAYRRAAERLDGIDDVRLDRVRRAVARELDALEAVRAPELARALARLERLARDSRQWPTQLTDAAADHPTDDDPEAEPAHWRDRLGGAMRGLVRVQARDEIGRTGEQFEAAREQLQLRLVAAQLALTRRDEAALALHLNAALELLDEWFDTASEDVMQAYAEIRTLASMSLLIEEPELGEALDLLRDRLTAS